MLGREGEEQPRPYNGPLETILGEQFSKWSHTRNVGTRRPRVGRGCVTWEKNTGRGRGAGEWREWTADWWWVRHSALVKGSANARAITSCWGRATNKLNQSARWYECDNVQGNVPSQELMQTFRIGRRMIRSELRDISGYLSIMIVIIWHLKIAVLWQICGGPTTSKLANIAVIFRSDCTNRPWTDLPNTSVCQVSCILFICSFRIYFSHNIYSW